MKADHYLLLGIILLFFTSGIVVFQIVDTTAPEFPYPEYMAFNPQGGKNYTKVTWVYVLCQDKETAISRVTWSLWQTGDPGQRHELSYYGWAHETPVAMGPDPIEFEFHWGVPYEESPLAEGDYRTNWEVWAKILDTPITEPGKYTFWADVYNGAGVSGEPPFSMPHTFRIASTTEGAEPEEPIPEPIKQGPVTGIPRTPQPPTSGITYEVPIILFGLGAILIMYGFMRGKKKGVLKKGSASLLILLIGLCALVVGILVGFQINMKQPFPIHHSVINTITIKDTTFNSMLVPVCVDSRENTWAEHSIITLTSFEEGRVYKQTTWLWQRYGDTEFCMTLWGPGEDHSTIVIELGRLGSNAFEVKIEGDTRLTIPQSTVSPDTGYWTLTAQIAIGT